MRVKICGITNLNDALFCIDAGADALGFVFYEKSPRYISPKSAREIIAQLPPFVEKVGLFVQHTSDEINEMSRQSGITLAQLHFDATMQTKKSLQVPYLCVKRVKSKEDLQKISTYTLVDAYVKEYGGMGKSIDLSWFKDLDCSKMILAGGLDEDILDEVKKYGFYGVDVSSAVELKKGIKDEKKVKEFIKKAKN